MGSKPTRFSRAASIDTIRGGLKSYHRPHIVILQDRPRNEP